MSSTSNSQNLLVNVFRPTYVYSSGTGYTPKLVLSNIDLLTANQIVTDNFQFGGIGGNVYIGSNVGGGSNNSNNVAVGVNAMASGSNTRGTIAIGYSSLLTTTGACNSVVIGTSTTGGGVSNVIVGAESGSTGSNVILLGPGLNAGSNSNKLYIGAGALSNTVIYADLATKQVGINTQAPVEESSLDVSGNAHISKWLAVGFDTARAAIDANGYVYSTLGFAAQGGSATAPAFTFIDDSGTGLYQRGTGFAITTGGQERVIITDASFGINGDLWVTGTVNISGIATNNLVIPGYIRVPSSTAPTIDLSGGNAAFAGTLDVASGIRAGVGSSIRVGTVGAPTVDISGSNIRASNVFATGYVRTPFVHDEAGTYDLSSGNLRVNSNITVSNVFRTPAGAIRVGNVGTPSIDISGSNVRADGTIQGAIVSAGSGLVSAPSHTFTTDTSLGLYRVGANQLGFASAGVQRMVISNGNVGIGKATPVVALEVVGDVSATTYNGPGGTAAAPHYTFSDDRTTGLFFPGTAQIGFTTASTERMRFSNGNIGIGTTAPTTALEISGGALRITSGSGGPIVLSNGTINVSGVTVVSSTGVFSNAATTSNSIGGVVLSNSNAIVGGFLRNALTPSQFDISGGNISNLATTRSSNFIGTATASNSIGGTTLSNGYIQTGSGTVSAPSYTFSGDTSAGLYLVGNSHIGITSAGVQRMCISGANVGIGTTAPNTALEIMGASNTTTAFRISTPDTGASAIPSLEFSRGGTFGSDTATAWHFRSIATSNIFALSSRTDGTNRAQFYFTPGSSGQILANSSGATALLPVYSFYNNSNSGMYSPGSTQLGFVTDNVARMVISNGNVGIGTDTPATALEVVGDITSSNLSNTGTVNASNIRTGDGTTSTPAYSFSSDSNLGFYRIGANQLGFASANSNRMVISNAYMGIGLLNPRYPLDICSSINNYQAQFAHPTGQATIIVAGSNTAGTCNAAQFFHRPPDEWGLFTASNLPFRVYTNSIAPLTLLGNGYVGIGTTNPGYGLDVSAVGTVIRGAVSLGGPLNSGNYLSFDSNVFFNQTSTGGLYIGAGGLVNTIANRSGTIFINSNGSRVGIGTTAPTAGLDISGGDPTVVVRNAATSGVSAAIRVVNGPYSDVCGVRLFQSATDQGLYGSNELPMVFIQRAIERMRITPAGRVGIGLTAPGTPLDVSGVIRAITTNANTSYVTIEGCSHPATAPFTTDICMGIITLGTGNFGAVIKGVTNSWADQIELRFATSRAANATDKIDRMTIKPTTGYVGIATMNPGYALDICGDLRISGTAYRPGGGSWTTTSDQRVKQNIQYADTSLCYAVVKNLPLKRYTWDSQYLPELRDKTVVGWIAQEVQQVFPKAVERVNAHGFSDLLALDVDQIYKTMYGALEKVIADKETLEARVLTLEDQLSNVLMRLSNAGL